MHTEISVIHPLFPFYLCVFCSLHKLCCQPCLVLCISFIIQIICVCVCVLCVASKQCVFQYAVWSVFAYCCVFVLSACVCVCNFCVLFMSCATVRHCSSCLLGRHTSQLCRPPPPPPLCLLPPPLPLSFLFFFMSQMASAVLKGVYKYSLVHY